MDKSILCQQKEILMFWLTFQSTCTESKTANRGESGWCLVRIMLQGPENI